MALHRTALVTGSTRGIGRAIAVRLAQDGCAVVVNHASAGSADSVLHEIRALGVPAAAVRADLTGSAECDRLVSESLRHFGQIDILVNNVGPFLEKPMAETTDGEWRQMIDGNLSSAFFCARSAIPAMRARKSGCIINIGALNSEVSPGMTHDAPAYFVAKAGLMTLTRTLARTEGPHGIRVNAVGPGFIETEAYAAWDDREAARWRDQIPLGRFGRPAEIAEAVAFLASEKASYISGAILQVHGGLWL